MIQAVRKILRKFAFDPDPQKALVEELNKIKYGEVAVNPANVGAGAVLNVDVALPAGTAAVGDLVFVAPPIALEAGLVAQAASIPVADTLRIRLYNPTAGGIDGANLTWTYLLLTHQNLSTY